MRVTLSGEQLRLVSLFEETTGATAEDCLIEDDRVVFLVTAGQMGEAIGADGSHVDRLEQQLDRSVRFVEDAATPEHFVANMLAPAAVTNVTISEGEETIAYVEVPTEDRGAAIGREGSTIETARTLAQRHYDINDVQLT